MYAVRARNPGGLGPQSDPVSVTTLAAPPPDPKREEPRVARAVAGVDFIIAGQTMDTSGTCNDDDIADIVAACTHNITNPMPQFGIIGEMVPHSFLSVRTGRDLLSAFNDPIIAGASDFAGVDTRIRLNLPPGRSLLRLNGREGQDTNTIRTYFYRINVVPYWELNGEQLSRSDDCKSTTDLTASEITDADCIALVHGNTVNLQFRNVIKAQFNAYVYVNTTEVVDAPEDSDLANPFALDLADGDNVIRVRIASKSRGARSIELRQ